jgi:hypothetical protein
MQYLEDRKKGDLGLDTTPPDVGYYTQFADDQKITKTVSYKLSGRSVTVTDGSEAVAFELRRDDKLVYFWNMASFTFHESLKIDGAKYYAVQADGTRVEMVQK